ncbi:MAG: FGGY family carbohydrate kinase, partial [Mycobacteriales bacterium]
MTDDAEQVILAIDQGTSATKALLIGSDGSVLARASASLTQSHPQPGWVEQSAEDIWQSVLTAVGDCCCRREGIDVIAIGLSTQRESLVLWDRRSGAPLGPMLSWQDQRSAADCHAMRRSGAGDLVRSVTGLPLDPMFSALKARWLLDHYDPDRSRSRQGELCLGTVDSWLVACLGGGHLIEIGNAARTQLLDVERRAWDPRMLDLFDVPIEVLPVVVPSLGPFPTTGKLPPLPAGTPVTGVLGDSHAALFAHAGWHPGQVKATYGTGASVMSLADPRVGVPDGLCLTIAWDLGEPAYAVEGNIRAAGATLSWLARFTGRSPAELAEMAATVGSDGVYLVPAFTGLGAPWWDESAIGLLSNITLGTGVAQVARAALESVAYQVEDVVAAVDRAVGPVATLLADGGPTANPTLMQLQADISGRSVERAVAGDLSAVGAAHAAGLAAGFWTWDGLEALKRDRE